MAYAKKRYSRPRSNGVSQNRLKGAFNYAKKWKNYAMIIGGAIAAAFYFGYIALTPKGSSTVGKVTGNSTQKNRPGATERV